MPISTSTRTPRVTPASVMAPGEIGDVAGVIDADAEADPFGQGGQAGPSSAGPTTWLAMRISSMPASASTSASFSLAQRKRATPRACRVLRQAAALEGLEMHAQIDAAFLAGGGEPGQVGVDVSRSSRSCGVSRASSGWLSRFIAKTLRGVRAGDAIVGFACRETMRLVDSSPGQR